MAYLVGFTIIAVVATILAGLAALIALVLPVRSKRFWIRLVRGAVVFPIVWLGIMICGSVAAFGTHNVSLGATEGAGVVPGLVRSKDQVLRAERVYRADTAQTYLLLNIPADEVEAFAKASQMRKYPFDAHTAEDRGWPVPAWWPKRACPEGVTYNDDSFGNPPRHLDYVINWCPGEGKAYVQHFDY